MQTSLARTGGTVSAGRARYIAGQLNKGTQQGFDNAVASMRRAGVDPDHIEALALRSIHGDEAARTAFGARVDQFLDDVALRHGIPRDQLVARSLNRSGSDLAQIRAGEGIVHGSDSAGTTATQHIGGTRHRLDPWISTSRSGSSTHFFGTASHELPQTNIVAIDLRHVGHPVVDVSTPSLATSQLATPRVQNFAAHHQEVLIRHKVNAEAIVGELEFGGMR